jgi:hypothetical protein
MLTLQELKEHALKNKDRLYPLGDCSHCLAADLTGKTMAGHERFVGDSEPGVPRQWVSFTRGVCAARFMCNDAERVRRDSQGTLNGAQIAGALEKIENGADPYVTGAETWTNASA